jgi:hypothetical protein
MLIECLGSTERLQRDSRDPIDEVAGTLAASILRTVNDGPRQSAASLARLTRWAEASMGEGANVAPRTASKALEAIRAQLRDWFEQGRVEWGPDYSDLDPHHGPTAVLSTAAGRRLIDAIEWRGLGVVRAATAEAAVLVSALHGAMSGTLVGCVACGRLTTISPKQSKRRKCVGCGARRRDRLAPSVMREYALAYDRIRKMHRSRPDERSRLSREIARLRDANQRGSLTAVDAVAQIRAAVPTGPRGRPRRA